MLTALPGSRSSLRMAMSSNHSRFLWFQCLSPCSLGHCTSNTQQSLSVAARCLLTLGFHNRRCSGLALAKQGLTMLEASMTPLLVPEASKLPSQLESGSDSCQTQLSTCHSSMLDPSGALHHQPAKPYWCTSGPNSIKGKLEWKLKGNSISESSGIVSTVLFLSTVNLPPSFS